jgi:hypothetical protein
VVEEGVGICLWQVELAEKVMDLVPLHQAIFVLIDVAHSLEHCPETSSSFRPNQVAHCLEIF